MPKSRSRRVDVIPEAREDLREVALYSRTRWQDRGRRYVRELRDVVSGLWERERFWKPVAEHASYLRFRYEKHNIYFTVEGDVVTVRAVLHEAQDPDRRL